MSDKWTKDEWSGSPDSKDNRTPEASSETTQQLRDEFFGEEKKTATFVSGQREPRDVDAMETVQLTEELPEDPQEEEDNPTGKILRNVLIAGIAIVAVVIVLFLILSKTLLGRSENSSQPAESSSSIEESYTGQSTTGVITTVDSENMRVWVYSSDTGKEILFELAGVDQVTDAYGNSIGFASLRTGQVVDVSYQEGSVNLVERLRLSSAAEEIRNAYGLTVSDGEIRYNGRTYQYDSHLVCTYGGNRMNPAEITEQYVVNLQIVGSHVYTAAVMQSVGTVQLTETENYENAKIVFTPSYGKPVEVTVEKDMEPIVLTEGFNKYKIEQDGATLASGTVFVEAQVRQQLALPVTGKNQTVVDVNVLPEGVRATVKLDGEEQDSTTLTVDYGEHELEISAEGYETVTQKITVSQPYMQVTVHMESTDIKVSLTTSLSGVVVYCDGEYMGVCDGTAVEFRLTEGTYYLLLAKSGYEAIGYDLVLNGNTPPVVNLYFSQFREHVEESSQEESSEEESSAEESSAEEESSQEESVPEENSAEESSSEQSVGT